MGLLIESENLRDRRFTFEDRVEAGLRLSESLAQYNDTGAIVLAIPSGGVPVAAAIAKELGLSLDLLLVRKVQMPGNPEAGIGAVGPEGEVILNTELISRLMISEEAVKRETGKAKKTVKKRERLFREDRPFPSIEGKTVIVVDDGLASGYTMLTSIEFLRRLNPERIIAAAPTAHEMTVEKVIGQVDELHCPNIRGGFSFAVADAYKEWYDLSDGEVLDILKEFFST